MNSLTQLNETIINCTCCPRLVAYRQEVAKVKRRAYQDEIYWGKPVPGLGDDTARLLVVGLAPGAHGANRTGRMFTGDKAGNFLYPALFKAGFSNQPDAFSPGDGLTLLQTYMTNVVHCVPPDNIPSKEETITCRNHLIKELKFLPYLKVVLTLGKLAFDNTLVALSADAKTSPGIDAKPRPTFIHGAEYKIGRYTLLACYHPSQRNTNTGLLTLAMLEAVMQRAQNLLR